MDIKKTIEMLSAVPGPSGFEEQAAEMASQLLEPYMDSVRTDRLGSVIGEKRCGRKDAKRLLLDAHIDQIGLIITGYDKGFLRFYTLGGVDPRMLPGRELTILSDPPVFGLVSCLPPHVQSKEDMEKAAPIKDMVIDVGMDEQSAKKCIPIGTPVIFAGEVIKLSETVLSGKAFDDRVCFATLLYALDKLGDKPLGVDLFVLGSVQEEVGTRGAITGAYAIAPDYCIAVDVTHGATPDAKKEETLAFGGGAVIGKGPNCSRAITNRLIETAKKKDIKYQIEVMEGHSGTNGWPIQVSREGVATAVLSVPLKYMHSPIETVSLSDVEATAELLAAFVSEFSGEI